MFTRLAYVVCGSPEEAGGNGAGGRGDAAFQLAVELSGTRS